MTTTEEDLMDYDEQRLVEARDKALMNIVVLERIIGFLPVTDMRSCRLVNSIWLDAATAQLRKKDEGPLIADVETVQSFLELWGLQDDGMEFQQQTPPPRPPFTRIALGLDEMNCEESLLDRSFRTMAPFVTELDLTISVNIQRYQFSNEGVYRNLSYPNLSEYLIRLEDGFKENGEDGERYRGFICGILRNAPNLRELRYYLYGSSDYDTSRKYFHSLIDTLKERKCGNKKLKRFGTYSGGMVDLNFSRMTDELVLNLETLDISTGIHGLLLGPGEDGLFRLLQGQAQSLKSLYLRFVTGLFEYSGVPKMKKLETLIVENWKPLPNGLAPTPTIVPSVNYQEYLPVLKKIKFADFNNDEWVQFLPRLGSPPVASLEELNLPTKVNTVAHIDHCVRSFPNLKILRIPSTVPYLNLVYKYLPQLEELILDTCGVTNIDDVITGFSLAECELIGRFTGKMLRRMKFQFKEDHPEEDDSDQMPISVLKNLKVLRLRPRFELNKVELTKVSSHLVLTKMESLQILDLSHRSERALTGFQDVIKDMEDSGKVIEYRNADVFNADYVGVDSDDDFGVVEFAWGDHLEDAVE